MRSVRSKIIAAFAFILIMTSVMSGWFYWGITRADQSNREMEWAYQKLQALTALSASAGGHFFELTEMLLVNEGPEELGRTKIRLDRSFEDLMALRAQQESEGKIEHEDEIERVRAMYLAYRQLASESEMIATLHQIGKTEEALERFNTLHTQMDTGFMTLIREAIDRQTELVTMQARMTEQLGRWLHRTTIGATIALLLVGVGLSLVIIRSVILPIRDLLHGVKSYSRGELDHRVPIRGKDELAMLAGAFNTLAAQLAEQREQLEAHNADLQRQIEERTKAEEQLRTTQSELCNASRRAGMADVATGVLHNVGNVLNSVNVSASTVSNCIRTSKLPLLAQAATLVEANKDTLSEFLCKDERGKFMPQFLTKISQSLAKEQATAIKELQSLAKNIDHIKMIVSMQQRYADGGMFHEMVHLPDVLRDAERMSMSSPERLGIHFVREFGEVSAVKSDKHRLMQILVNLITNAKNSLNESQNDNCTLTVRLESDAQKNEVVISVADTGGGIDPAHMPRLFTQGFTTREKGHGFGLHASVIAARELGGTLTAQSEGAGKGATFTLRIPINGPTPQMKDEPIQEPARAA